MFQWEWADLRLQDLPYGTAERLGVPQLQTKFDENQKLEQRQISTRARGRTCFTCLFWTCGRPGPPALGGLAERARARARALSTNQNFKITTFLLVNFKNDHGKSCSVSRDWQPPKISAQCVPISQSNDQKPISFNFKERISAQFSHHFLIFFADIPLPRPPSLSAVPYGESRLNLKLESRWKSHDFQICFWISFADLPLPRPPCL